ncbi:MAG: hypothetical protein EXR73_02600 [Myxococcales bacterium]|nr:hypothetical protein [Myxococcales bacterium]
MRRAVLLSWFRRCRGTVTGPALRDVGKVAQHAAVTRVKDELRHLGIRVPLRFIWSADGSGVEEDAPHIVHLHRSLVAAERAPAAVVAAAERLLAFDLAAVARHEVGHALLFRRPRAAHAAEFRRLFGDVRLTYRVGTPLDEVERRLTRHGGLANSRYRREISLYSATHPHERFAEAVRIALALAGSERALRDWAGDRNLAPTVTLQLVFAGRWLREYANGS